MVAVIYIEPDGTERSVYLQNGISVMQGAVAAGISGIDGDCGGSCACGTCHVHIDAAWMDRLPPRDEIETQMLDFTEGAEASSRLACQIKVHEGLEGIVFRVAASQY